jgi:hypothetical protein
MVRDRVSLWRKSHWESEMVCRLHAICNHVCRAWSILSCYAKRFKVKKPLPPALNLRVPWGGGAECTYRFLVRRHTIRSSTFRWHGIDPLR